MAAADELVTLTLRPQPPFRLDYTVWVLRRRPENQLDHWDGTSYRRAFLLDGRPVVLTVRQCGTPDDPQLTVLVHGARAEAIPGVQALLTWTLGLDVDLAPFSALAANDPVLMPLVARFRGFKPTRYPTLFEALVNAIVCQQVTLAFGIQLLNRFVHAFGVPVESPDGVAWAFPGPEAVASLSPEDLRPLALSRQKALAIIEAARAILAGAFDHLEHLSDDEAAARLRTLRGIGRWSAEYVLLRGLGRLAVFPGDDVGARRNLRAWLGLPETLDYDGVSNVLRPWQAYAGLLYFHLLLNRLAESGLLVSAPQP